jgi:transcriptional regulator with PAS, ATPase and Fis domain
VRQGEFREDLYYRINVITVTQPPLRERIGDILLLTEHYLTHFNEQMGKTIEGFNEEALGALRRYSWPGNVRELVNVVERSVVLSKGAYITLAELPDAIRREDLARTEVSPCGPGANLKSALALPERQIILDALAAHGWGRQETAKALGINRTTLYKKMKKYGIEFERQMV